ncbi:MAG: hypothetical protein QNJ12_06140 [Ilumatobacter sp.]|uniref:hypothetical protein n=1 Tax=Ilumatobacter sp. TaxID=1967498 RepID=UPI00262F2731|nr:hypothetical protein [Ilumatobacter sp.]MDJ0768352.1 hypothetical protein [Ilumatobacter sp.]
MKVYGVQRSGTNWMRFVIEQNFVSTHVVDLPLGSKHAAPDPVTAIEAFRDGGGERYEGGPLPFQPSELDYDVDELEASLRRGDARAVVVIKSLVPWLASYHRYRRLKAKNQQMELTPKVVEIYTNLWIERNSAFVLGVPEHFPRWLLADHAAFLSDFDAQMEHMASTLELVGAHPTWVNTDKAMKRGGDLVSSDDLETTRPFRPETQTVESASELLTPETLQTVTDLVEATDLPPILAPFAAIDPTLLDGE